MRHLLLCALLAAGCRTRPLDATATAPDLASGAGALDLAAAFDLASVATSDLAAAPFDLAGDQCAASCPVSCDEATSVCVYLNRGDCSSWTCVARPAACVFDVSCECMGGDAFCAGFANSANEKLTCGPPPARVPCGQSSIYADLTCTSNFLCI